MSFAEAIVPKFQGNSVIAMASHGSDAGLMAEFFIEDEYQTFKSELEGRAIYLPVEKVRIWQPGNKSDIIKHVQLKDEPNMPSHPNRFPRQWAAFKAQQTQVPDGTPLEMCKFIPSHRVKELKSKDVHTAEQFASLPDSTVQTFGMDACRLRDLCAAYVSEDNRVAKLSAALAENNAMKADLEAMKSQLSQLSMANSNRRDDQGFHTETLTDQPKRGPGRPKKELSNDD